MVKGVRKMKSKMAGGVELFSVSDITFIRGKGDVGTLISARLKTHYGEITKNIERVQGGYELIKLINKATEDEPEPAYFHLMDQALQALNDPAIGQDLIQAWFEAQLLKLGGHTPNLKTDSNDRPLNAESKYNFDLENMAFTPAHGGRLGAAHIKALRLLFSQNPPQTLNKVDGLNKLLKQLQPLVRTMLTSYVRV